MRLIRGGYALLGAPTGIIIHVKTQAREEGPFGSAIGGGIVRYGLVLGEGPYT